MAGQRHENNRDVHIACSTLPSTPACIYVGNCSQITYIFMRFYVSIFFSSFIYSNWDHDHTSHDSDTHTSWWLLKKLHQITIAQTHLTPSPHNPNWWYVMQNKWVESVDSYSIVYPLCSIRIISECMYIYSASRRTRFMKGKLNRKVISGVTGLISGGKTSGLWYVVKVGLLVFLLG
jgi:hypothetical protein